jgi:hypothetical protein
VPVSVVDIVRVNVSAVGTVFTSNAFVVKLADVKLVVGNPGDVAAENIK